MNKFLPATVSILFLLLSSLVASMGGYLVADVAVWAAFLQALTLGQLPTVFVINLSNEIRLPFWESLYDRFTFLQVNDPLLI